MKKNKLQKFNAGCFVGAALIAAGLFHTAAATISFTTVSIEPNTASLIDLAGAPVGQKGYPIPAGSTLIDVSDSGKQVLFSSMDTNIVTGEQSIPTTLNLYWMDLSNGFENPTIRLVTHFAGMASTSVVYYGIGNGLIPPAFEPLSADLSGNGQFVVFDSRVSANSFDATVPAQNDVPSVEVMNDLFSIFVINGAPLYGTPDVFIWNAGAPDPNNNITTVSLLNAAGKAAVVQIQPQSSGSPAPDLTKPMAVGVLPEVGRNMSAYATYIPWEQQLWQQIFQDTFTANRGLSNDGTKVLYSTGIPAQWIDTLNPSIQDDLLAGAINLSAFIGLGMTNDGFLVTGANNIGAAALANSGSTRTATVDKSGNAQGYWVHQTLPVFFDFANVPAPFYEPVWFQLSGNGRVVVYSTRVPGSFLIEGVQDSHFSEDVYAFDVATGKNILISRLTDQNNVAAGFGQGSLDSFLAIWLQLSNIVLYDSQNLAISEDGSTIAIQSGAGNLINGYVNNNVEQSPREFFFNNPYKNSYSNVFPYKPVDLYAVKIKDSVSYASATQLINTPNGNANTNLTATLGGMSSDGSTFLFSTAANNFYKLAFSNPPYPPFATGMLDSNTLLGGFSNVWARNITTNTTSLVSVSADGTTSGNQLTTMTPVAPGARDTLANVSTTGRFVLFSGASNNLVTGINDPNFAAGKVFLRDMQAGITKLVSTTATGNVPSKALLTQTALSTNDAAGTTRVFLGGTLGADMQTAFDPKYVSGAHIYALDYPLLTPASADQNPAKYSVSGLNYNNTILEYYGSGRSVEATPGVSFNAQPYTGGARVAMGDVNGDGTVDYIYGTPPGQNAQIEVFDGVTNAQIMNLQSTYTGGVYVGAGDVNRDGYADIIIGTDQGAATQVIVVSGNSGQPMITIPVGGNAGARVASGDVDGDGYADIIVGTGQTMAVQPQVTVYSGASSVKNTPTVIKTIPVTDTSGTPNGIYVASADMNGDGLSDIVTGSDTVAAVRVYNATDSSLMAELSLVADTTFSGGVRVAARPGVVMIGSGPGMSAQVRLITITGQILDQFSPTPIIFQPQTPSAPLGLFVG